MLSHKISDAELEIMRVLWQEGRPLSFSEIRTALEKTTDWKKSTIQTLLSRLKEKGIINADFHHVLLYSSNMSEKDFMFSEERSFIDKLFGGSAKNLVASLCRNGQLNAEDVDELKAFFNMEDNA